MANPRSVDRMLARRRLHRLVRPWRHLECVHCCEPRKHRKMNVTPTAKNRREMRYPCQGVEGPKLPRYATEKLVFARSAACARKKILALSAKASSPTTPAPHDFLRANCFMRPNETQDQLPRALCACDAAYAHDGRHLQRKSQACSRSAASP